MFDRLQIFIKVIGTGNDSVNFLKDISPVLISSIALLISVIAPYLIVRYEKVFTRNKEHKEFLRKTELFILEWLNVTSENEKIINEFLEVIKSPQGIFPKSFEPYEFPSLEFFNTYNVALLNECYLVVRRLKGFNHHLQIIITEYTAYRRLLVEKDSNKIANGTDFFITSLEDMQKQFPNIFTDLTELRIIITLLLKKANKVESLTFKKFFNLNPANDLWHKKDISFTKEEIETEAADIEKKRDEFTKRKSPLN